MVVLLPRFKLQKPAVNLCCSTLADKLGRVRIKAVPSTLGTSRLPLPQAFRQEMHLSNATISVDLTSGVSIDVWVDATADSIRVNSRGPAHKLQATLEVWRNKTTGYPAGLVNGSVIYKPPLGCPSLHSNSELWPHGLVHVCGSRPVPVVCVN